MSIVLKQRHSEQYSPCYPVGDTTPSQNSEQKYIQMEQEWVKKNTFFAVVKLANPFLLISPPEREYRVFVVFDIRANLSECNKWKSRIAT
jgi:hypothetical protein